MTRSAEATVRRPGTRIAPITSTSTCSQVGAVNASRKGSRKVTRLFGTRCPVAPAMHPSPNRWLGRLARRRSDANPHDLHVGFRSRMIQPGSTPHPKALTNGGISLPRLPRQPPLIPAPADRFGTIARSPLSTRAAAALITRIPYHTLKLAKLKLRLYEA